MATIGSSIGRVTTNPFNQPVTPLNDQISMVASGTEYPYALPNNCVGFMLSAADSQTFKMKLSYQNGGTLIDKYKTISAKSTFTDEHYYTAQTIYVSADTNNAVAEIICWSITP